MKNKHSFTFLFLSVLCLFTLFFSSCITDKWTQQTIDNYNKLPPLPGEQDFNVVYKKAGTTDLLMDIYHAIPKDGEVKADQKNPVYVFIFGGAWISGSKETVRVYEGFRHADRSKINPPSLIGELNKKGITVVSFNYRYIFKAGLEGLYTDVEDAFLFMLENSDKYHLDMNNVAIGGQSAGAQLALQFAFTQANKFQSPKGPELSERDKKLMSIQIKGIVDEYGPTDLIGLAESIPVFASYDMGLDNTMLRMFPFKLRYNFSPLYRATAYAPDILILHGQKDDMVPLKQSIELITRLNLCNDEQFEKLPLDYNKRDLDKRFLYRFYPNGDHGLWVHTLGHDTFINHWETIIDYITVKLGK